MQQNESNRAGGDKGAALPPKLVCRQIAGADLPAVVDLLTRGFPSRPRSYWEHALEAMALRSVPPDCPRFGFVLASGDRLAGVVLLLFSEPRESGADPRCFVSSWYVEDEFRAYASWLISRALKQKQAVYLNMSSASHTRGMIAAQGFSCYAQGVFFAVAALAPGREATKIVPADAVDTGDGPLSALLADHARYGCISLICMAGGRTYPFVFLRRRIPKTVLPCVQLIYCGDIADFIRFARPLGRYLLRHGLPVVMVDANGPLEGLPGRYFPGRLPKYFRGPAAPRLGDLAYSEAVLFGP
jgi:hypothetical protein